MRTQTREITGVVLLLIACGATVGCATVESTELLIEVRTKDLHFGPGAATPRIDEIEIRVLRVMGPADEIDDAGVLDAGPPVDAGVPPTSCPPRVGAFVDGDDLVVERSCTRYAIPADARPPLTLGIVPSDGESSLAQLKIRATAFLAGAEVVSTHTAAGFVPHTLVRVPPLVLSAGCIGAACPAGTTCNDDVCVPAEPLPGCLVRARVDAGPDWARCGAVGVPDAGPDAAPVDAGPRCGDGSCNNGETCATCEVDCQNGHLGARASEGEPCAAELTGAHRCVTSTGPVCAGLLVPQRCNGTWRTLNCSAAMCERCFCFASAAGDLDPYCQPPP